MGKTKSIIISIPIFLTIFRLALAIIQIKLSKKDSLLHKYLVEDEAILAYGNLIYIKRILQAVLSILIGFLIGIAVFVGSGNGFWALTIILYFIMFSAFNIINSYVLKKTTYLVITNKRLITLQGVFRNDVYDYQLDKISNISMNQGILGRIFNYAKVSIISTGGSELKIGNDELNLKNAEEFIKAFVSVKSS